MPHDNLAPAERLGIDEDALMAFVETIGEVLGERTLTVETARRAALLAAAGQAWESELGPLLDSAQVRVLLGDVSRQHARRVDRRVLVRVTRRCARRPVSGAVGARWR